MKPAFILFTLLLLNVPPDRTGRIPEYHVKALMELKEEIK
jgi:alpha-L-fucosidase